MADETPHRQHMRFRQPCYITAEAFDLRRTKPAGCERVKHVRTRMPWLFQIPSFEAIRLEKRHDVVLDRRHPALDSVRPDVAAAGYRLQRLQGARWSVQAPESRDEAVAGPAHHCPRRTPLNRDRFLQSAGRIAPQIRHASPGAGAP